MVVMATEKYKQASFWKIRVPKSLDNLDGDYVLGECAEIKYLNKNSGIALLMRVKPPVQWLKNEEYVHEFVHFDTVENMGELRTVRTTTKDELRLYRIPNWISGEQIPMCCNQPMFFVSQFDDGNIWSEAPPDAKMWWHDTASFYIFTCSQCLSVTAVGQQY
jgi:hypothetical protein